ncbi:glycosyltransferase family 2 protein [Wenyingzhuangia aestuarii]|uniref:glycosyltransferase family 2 protein n=1 Tax=Wenyingzhuangia aestuarii TaxID=1647582 RepID=UPI00143AA07C|nr:glycosyltransferase [Wenyingzhuangia aestuarii]NJB81738.1 GT2 family glycosyltransferase [Wenyingzhuangia aestuarii]
MITIALTYRNRDIISVEKCLNSLANQTIKNFIVYLVDYGSHQQYQSLLKKLVSKYSFIELIQVPTQNQLWNKSRAINIALKKCHTEFFVMGDIDLLYHPNFLNKGVELAKKFDAVYFRYGFLNKEESQTNKEFIEYKIDYFGDEKGTGTNIYKTDVLKDINGYDEFYHGWGAEDTDVHLRLKNAGYSIRYYDNEILVKHIYHPKTYRSKKSKEPFHSGLEKINHHYMLHHQDLDVTKANLKYNWGSLPTQKQIELIKDPLDTFSISNKKEDVDAFVIGVLPQLNKPLEIHIEKDEKTHLIKNSIKRILKKKYVQFYSLEAINNKVLDQLISSQRLSLYRYEIDWDLEKITLKIIPLESK